ncbi:MAG: ornithine-acyl-ACP acyltransferase [Yoonia sp.]|nr:ornithine-acyl-ACP acyltransferase [Yoonia sp.]
MQTSDDRAGGDLVCTLRLRVFGAGEGLCQSYTGSFYDLSQMQGPAIELGRFWLRDRGGQADVMRLALSEITRLVDATNADFLFGCTSFRGNDPALYAAAFACLAAHHQGPVDRIPKARTEAIALPHAPFDLLVALRQMSKLLRSYLGMHGWVGDAIVIDERLQTMHVFTCLDVGAVPRRRAEILRNLGRC